MQERFLSLLRGPALFIAGFFACVSAQAAGLSGFVILSTVGEPLQGGVKVLYEDHREFSSLKLEVLQVSSFEGSTEGVRRFDRADQDRRFSVSRAHASGSKEGFFLISTRDIVTEPVVSIAVRLTYPSGSMVRTYRVSVPDKEPPRDEDDAQRALMRETMKSRAAGGGASRMLTNADALKYAPRTNVVSTPPARTTPSSLPTVVVDGLPALPDGVVGRGSAR